MGDLIIFLIFLISMLINIRVGKDVYVLGVLIVVYPIRNGLFKMVDCTSSKR